MDRLLADQRASLCTYINEYTYDMVPKPGTAFDGQFDFLFFIFMPGTGINQIEKLLTKRKKTLPSNGILFKFEYHEVGFSIGVPESMRISEILIKEVYHDGKSEKEKGKVMKS